MTTITAPAAKFTVGQLVAVASARQSRKLGNRAHQVVKVMEVARVFADEQHMALKGENAEGYEVAETDQYGTEYRAAAGYTLRKPGTNGRGAVHWAEWNLTAYEG